MARDDEYYDPKRLERADRIRPTRSLTQLQRGKAYDKEFKKSVIHRRGTSAAATAAARKKKKGAKEAAALANRPARGRGLSKNERAAFEAAEAPAQLADPGTNPTTRQPLDRSTRVGRGSQGVTGFATAAQQLKDLRAQSDAGAPLPGRETADRGFQYQPSQFAQERALRNARVSFNATANKYRDQRGLAQAQANLKADFAGNPALQGLERSKRFQDNITTDQNAAIAQRGQDADFNLGLRRMRGEERIAAGRNQSAETIAGNRDATALEGIERRGQYDLRGEQVRAQADREAAQLKARTLQSANNQAQGNKEFDQMQTIFDNASMQRDEDGNVASDPNQRRALVDFATRSQISTAKEAQAATTLFQNLAGPLERAKQIADSSHPMIARMTGFFKANSGKSVTWEQMKGEMLRTIDDPKFAREFASNAAYRDFIKSMEPELRK